MKYVLIDATDVDWFLKEFDDVNEAIAEGDDDFCRLTKNDKNRRREFVLIESADPDEDAENHLDGNEVRRWI